MSGWIGCNLDGTLAEYHGWKGDEHIGPMVPLMKARVQRWLEEGREVRIFTARVSVPEIRERVTGVIQDYLEANGLPRLTVTNIKDFRMTELWDDRAVQVRENTGRPVR